MPVTVYYSTLQDMAYYQFMWRYDISTRTKKLSLIMDYDMVGKILLTLNNPLNIFYDKRVSLYLNNIQSVCVIIIIRIITLD